ncbi:glycosyltransferase [Solitalea canadensis]|uniref:Glycosyltransferase n=1 Tax=Solitalea canadensis (strain ATCC 29591 / DSM 3403 / JCM 21819 / LMG 8368 / NBRC 15130 / NCIMB 12057 / USAM 9D) TaxID=929556 RepID=H8KNQ4_SOLCM|nr:glycosyltransferase [Solitalea canadensis]AFD08187.1 glycosyltransferase [Solitalea canadensis DSM 3403]
MKVLVIPAWYNSDIRPLAGNFFGEQTRALITNKIDASLIYTDFKPLSSFRQIKLKDFLFLRKYQVNDNIPTFRINGINILNIKYALGKRFWTYLTLKLYDDYVERFGVPDVVQAHAYMSGYVAYQLKKRYNIPYVLTEHSSTFLSDSIKESQAPFVREAFNNSDVLTAVSKPLALKMQKYTNKEIVVTPNFINTDFFEPDPDIKKYEIFTFLFVAGLREIKNIPLLIKAFKSLTEKVSDVQLIIGGDGDILEDLKLLVESYGLADKVLFPGKLSREEVVTELNKAHVFVVSSFFETFGVVVIEALSMGLPVIATKCGGPEYILTDNLGVLVENNNEEEYAQAMLFVYQNYNKYDPVELRTHAIINYSDNVVSTNMIDIYKETISNYKYAEKSSRV